jgi:RNA polymerase sigma-70 factor (ECF subfamily)
MGVEVRGMSAKAASAHVAQDERAWERELPELMVRYQQGDRAAVEELVQRLGPRLLRFFFGSQVQRSDAEDLFQECWMKIHRARHTYRAPEAVLPWIFAIARHTRVDGYRKQRRKAAREVLVADPPEAAAWMQPKPEAGLDEFLRMLESLPESQREVILMLKVSGMSLEEVAQATSSTVGAIKQKAHRAYARLRKVLK